ncbi:MAG: CBS domain-containing protein [Crenarchaeota archaeon]|nr:CBS domain-containing protein [Thermoproteota archaeon]
MKNEFNLFQVLTPKVSTFYIKEGSTIRQAIEKFAFHKFSAIPIIKDNGEYLTSISEGDVLRYIASVNNFDISLSEVTPVEDIEKYRPYLAIGIDATFDELYALSLTQNFIPIVDDRNMFIGIVKRRDVFVYLKMQCSKSLDQSK